MAKYQAEHRERIQEEQRQKVQEQEKFNQEFWTDIANTIKESREFAGIKVTEREKRNFYKLDKFYQFCFEYNFCINIQFFNYIN